MKNQNAAILFVVLAAYSLNAQTQKQAMVYTTAFNTALRLNKTGTADFKPMGQPLETQI
jgi:hypothetical protein